MNELLTRPSCRSKRQIPVKNWNRVACDLLSSGGSGSGGSDWGVKHRSFAAHPFKKLLIGNSFSGFGGNFSYWQELF